MDFLQNLIALPGPETVQHIFFPGLGLEFDLNRVAIVLLGRPIYWYGIIIVSGLILAVALCSRWGKRYGISQDNILDLMLKAGLIPSKGEGRRLVQQGGVVVLHALGHVHPHLRHSSAGGRHHVGVNCRGHMQHDVVISGVAVVPVPRPVR